jgi:hypothetical protein
MWKNILPRGYIVTLLRSGKPVKPRERTRLRHRWLGIGTVIFCCLFCLPGAAGGAGIVLALEIQLCVFLLHNEARNTTKSTLTIEYEQSLYLNACPVKGGKRGYKHNSTSST